MEFFGEIDFLSIIEEEHEEDLKSLQIEVMDNTFNEICQLEKPAEIKKTEEKRSKIPVRLGRSSLAKNLQKYDEKYSQRAEISDTNGNEVFPPENSEIDVFPGDSGDENIEFATPPNSMCFENGCLMENGNVEIENLSAMDMDYLKDEQLNFAPVIEGCPNEDFSVEYTGNSEQNTENFESLEHSKHSVDRFEFDKDQNSDEEKEFGEHIKAENCSSMEHSNQSILRELEIDINVEEVDLITSDSIPIDETLLTKRNYHRKSDPDIISSQDVQESDKVSRIDRNGQGIPSDETGNSQKNSGNELGAGGEDIDFREVVQSFLLSEENSNNLDLTFYPVDPPGTTLAVQESDDPILEAPVEFRSSPGGSELSAEADEASQVPPPAPFRRPEEEPPGRNHHNDDATETGDTTQRSESSGENVTDEEGTQESARELRRSGTASDLPAFSNSTEDNDHVEPVGDNGDVSAVQHVGFGAPIQRHDMPQIDQRRGETAELAGTTTCSSSVPCLTQCQIDSRRGGGLGAVLKGETAEETYDHSRCDSSALHQYYDRYENDQVSSLIHSKFDVWKFNSDSNSLNTFCFSGSSSEDSSLCSLRNFSFEEYLDDVPEMFSDRYKFKFSKVVGGKVGLEEEFVGVQDTNNNVQKAEDLFHKKLVIKERQSSVAHDLSAHPASSSTEESLAHSTYDAHLGPPKPLSSIQPESPCVPASAPGRSPTKTAANEGCVGSNINSLSGCSTSSAPEDCEQSEADAQDRANVREARQLRWSFKNGRLVFDDSESDVNDNKVAAASNKAQPDSLESGELKLTSREVNKRIDENKSRLRYLEEKLKKAGIGDRADDNQRADAAEQVVDGSESSTEGEKQDNEESDNCVHIPEVNGNDVVTDYELSDEGLTSFTGGEDFCQFDVTQVSSFPAVLNGYCLVYDELNQGEDSEEDFHVISFDESTEPEEQLYVLSNKPSAKMGTDSDRPKHNPDTENLKSLLKRPGRNRDKKSNRVVFNENKNEFFDADYIILIREECDYDDEDDDSVCTCNQHEMVRLTCCEPNCNCSVYEGYDQTPQSPKFAPPLEFVDAVTLSPPEGYKDMELEEQELFALQQMARRGQQRHAVCKECSATHDDNGEEGDSSQSDEGGGPHSDAEESWEREKTDQSQQTTPTTPENCTDDKKLHDFAVDQRPMTASERASYSSDDERKEERPAPAVRLNVPVGGSPISGILKGGKLWKQPSLDGGVTGGGGISNKTAELQQNTDSSATSDEEGSQRRFVRFIENESTGQRDGCDGASDDHSQDETSKEQSLENERTKQETCHNNVSPDTTEMMLTFKLGNHVLISNNSLKPNSAVRQLFPCTKPTTGKEDESIQQYLVTAESLRAFEEAKRSKLPQIIQSGETDESIRKAIERNTLRRSLIRYEPRSRKNQPKTDNSLVERIKQLTCNVDDVQVEQGQTDNQSQRASPPGEESRNSPEVTALKHQHDKSFSPSSSSTTSSNASSVSSTYKKITDLFTKKVEKPLDNQNNVVNSSQTETKITPTLPDLGNGPHEMDHSHMSASRINSTTNESRKQFLASLAPLTACVSGFASIDDYYYQMNNHGGDRASMASSVGTEYSLEDIDEALKNDQEETKRITPDVLAGTPSASESGDELAMFVQQDAGRIERIKKKYQPETNKEEDDEHDDYGFNKRPSVRGIKPRFGTTTQIIQEIQNQMQPPESAGRISWPYYSESGLSNVDNSKNKNPNQNIPHQYPPDEFKSKGYPPPYRPTSLAEENMYQSGQYCRQVYRMNGNPNSYPSVMKVGARCNEMYQSLPRQKSSGRPLSPPPSEVSRTYHQTMVYIPYNHIEGCQSGVSSNVYYQHSDYARVSNQNQINKRYIDPVYQQRFHMHVEDHHYHYNSSVMTGNPPKQMIRIPYPPQPHSANASESPLPGQFSTAARGTQTPMPNCNYYSNTRYRPVIGPVWQGDPAYVSKMSRHSFPMGPRYSTSDTSTDTDSSQGIPPSQNGYRQSIEISFTSQKDVLGSSPTKAKFTERGVPEGAASVSPPDTIKIVQSNSSTMTSPTSPQNASIQSQKPMFYAMNV